MVPGAAMLPAMESGSLVRMDVPVAELAVARPGAAAVQSHRVRCRRISIVAQDGLPRAARLVN